MKRNDWLLASGIFLIAVAILAFQLLKAPGDNTEVKVSIQGKVYGTYRLTQNQTIHIDDKNTVIIEDGTARMEWADCPDQICVQHKKISRSGESIICLPNEVVVSIEGSEEPEVDSIAQ